MELKSSQIKNNEMIPAKYTCDGEDVSPPLSIENVPESAKSLALIVDDPDAPGKTWVHWVVYDIPVMNEIEENEIPGKQGLNDFSKKDYGGPCPPSGTHRYFFKLYALEAKMVAESGLDKRTVLEEIRKHVLAEGQLIGTYER